MYGEHPSIACCSHERSDVARGVLARRALAFEVENVNYHEALAVHQHDVSANKSMLVARRRWWQLLLEFVGAWPNLRPQIHRYHCVDYQPFLQSGRQTVPLRQSRRQVRVVFVVPATHDFVIMAAVAIAMIIVVIMMLVMSVGMPVPMPVVVVIVVGHQSANAE